MESNDKKNKLAKIFQEFMHLNQEQIGYFQSTRDYLVSLEDSNRIDSSELLEKNSVNGISYSVFNSDDSKKLKAIYSRLDVDAPIVIDTLDEFVKFLKDEENKLKELFNNLDFEEISTLKQFNEASIRYNEKENLFLKKLQIKAPEILKLESQVFGIEENILEKNNDIFKESAKNFINFYLGLYSLILNKAEKEVVFDALVSTLKYLEQYIKSGNTINQDFAKKFISAVNKQFLSENLTSSNPKEKLKISINRFLNNFFMVNASVGKSIIREMNEFLKELGYEDGRIKKTYESANNDNKLDKFLKKAIEQLFNGVEFNEENDKKVSVKDLATKITKVDDKFKEIEDSFNERYETLQRTKFGTDMSFKTGKNFDDILIYVNGMKDEISIKKFKEKYLNEDNKNIVKSANIYLGILIDSDKKKDPFKTFKKRQEDAGILNEGSGSSSDELWSNEDEISEDNILDIFNIGISQISDNLIAIEKIIENNSNFDSGSLNKSALSSINDSRVLIVNIFKSFGKNLDSYFSKKMLSSSNLDNVRNDIKILIERWNKISDKSSINNVITDTKNLIDKLEN